MTSKRRRASIAALLIVATLMARPAAVVTAAQDTTTLLSKFLVDLRNGTLGVVNAVTSLTLGGNTLLCSGGTNIVGLGGCTSAFPGWKRTGAVFEARLANDGGYTQIVGSTLNATSALALGGVVFLSGTAPTVSSGFGSSPSITANGTAAFTINVGTGGTASGGVFTMPAATTGWACRVENLTANAANRANQRTLQTATTTTSVTIQNQTISTGAALAWTASDIVQLMCSAY